MIDQIVNYRKMNGIKEIRKGFLKVDQDMLINPGMRDELGGTTAFTVLIKEKKLYIGNYGDSRALTSVRGRVDPNASTTDLLLIRRLNVSLPPVA